MSLFFFLLWAIQPGCYHMRRMPIKRMSTAVIPSRCPQVSMASRIPHILERHASLASTGDEERAGGAAGEVVIQRPHHRSGSSMVWPHSRGSP